MSALPNIFSVEKGNFHLERELRSRGFSCIAGSDEVGRGPLAGPVVAACVTLPINCDPSPFLDSKKLSHKKREHLLRLLQKIGAVTGIGIVSHRKIDTINILQASLHAMKLAVFNHSAAGCRPDFILVDGKFNIPLNILQQTLIKGESKSASIAAASIVAKLKRDAIMTNIHHKYPQYNFTQHKGYPTKAHREAVAEYGPCPIHRMTFKGVREFVSKAP
jgi:ribonuclease HII